MPLLLWVAALGPQALAEAGANGYHLAAAPPAGVQKIYEDAPAPFLRQSIIFRCIEARCPDNCIGYLC